MLQPRTPVLTSRVCSVVLGRAGTQFPEDKIVGRYHRSLGLLMDAIRRTSRAYVFDNSGLPGEHTWIAEITDGRSLELKTNRVPAWFKRAVLDKISASMA